ncbi:MAG: hypothetical protein F4X35_03055 [Alphaproteobacteria bacterium]|nr:hypothetical protein [Alphaproteobacteria bacterium]
MSGDERRQQIGAAWERLQDRRQEVACWKTKVAGLLDRMPEGLTLDTVTANANDKWLLSAQGQILPEWPTHAEIQEAVLQLTVAQQQLADAEAVWALHEQAR